MQWVPVLALFNSYITAAIDADDTSCVLKSVTSIPTAPFHAVLDGGTTKEEVVKVTAITTATKTLTIVRAQGGTSGVAHAADTLFHACEIGAVNLHLDGLAITLAGSSELNAMALTVTDTTTNSSGYSRGLYIAATASGTKTGSGEHNSLGIDLTVTGDMAYAYITSLYLATSGNPTISLISAMSIYLDDNGTGVSNVHMLDLQTGNPTASAPSTRYAYMRCRNHGTGTPTCIMFLQANNNAKAATYLIDTGGNNETGPVAAAVATGDSTWTYKVKCRYGSTDFWLVGCAAA